MMPILFVFLSAMPSSDKELADVRKELGLSENVHLIIVDVNERPEQDEELDYCGITCNATDDEEEWEEITCDFYELDFKM